MARYVVGLEERAGRRRYRLSCYGPRGLEGEVLGSWVAPWPAIGLCPATIEGERLARSVASGGDIIELPDGTERYL